MAPTASMLLIPYHNKSMSPLSSPTSTPSATSFYGAKFFARRWVRQDNLIFKVRSKGKASFMAGLSSPANDSDEEKRFEEALERSCWC